MIPPNNFPVQYLGRGSDGRTPFCSQLDLFAAARVQAGRPRSAWTLSVNVINLFDQETATNYFPTQLQSGQGVNFSEEAFYRGQVDIPGIIASQNIPQDPRFLMDGFGVNTGYQLQRALRIGVGVSF